MKRTQIQLDEDTYEQLRKTAYERRTSMAEVIREAVAEYLTGDKERQPKGKLTLADFPWIGMASVDDGDLAPVSERHDEALGEALLDDLRRGNEAADVRRKKAGRR